MEIPPTGHDPVLLSEVLESLALQPGQTVIDCTTGRAGHASVIARELGPDGLLVGLDVDPLNLEFARSKLADAPCPVRLFHASFSEIDQVMDQIGRPPVHAILADLGLSTNQLFDPRCGLSFASDMPLDMRIDPRIHRTAADLVNSLAEEDLANVLYELAQERFSRRIARKIVEARRSSPIKSTQRLAELVRSAIPNRESSREKIDPATRTFLALRMKVNGEMENLRMLLEKAPQSLARAGRLGIISFQSMEDRMVKQAFRFAEQTGLLRIVTKRPVTPSESEITANPRSRSAKLRVAERS
jgi:16S rRNA (cytosine1402-N4)-methyltransferase